jgi:hypothetical protein
MGTPLQAQEHIRFPQQSCIRLLAPTPFAHHLHFACTWCFVQNASRYSVLHLFHRCITIPSLQVYNGAAPAAPNKSRSGSICYDFVKGVCTRGSECRYSHDLTLIARMARGSGDDSDAGQQADVCFDYLRWARQGACCAVTLLHELV